MALALTIPEGVAHADTLIAGLDRCFVAGFGRLGKDDQAALAALGRTFAGTPLGEAVAGALDGLSRNEFTDKHFAVLAAARSALQGAQYDALCAAACQALGRPVPPPTPPPAALAPAQGHHQVFQESTRHWLMEVAVAGFGRLDDQTLAPFTATLEKLQAEPALTRLAALVTGFQNELLASLPVSALPALPATRWADLWCRAMLASLRPLAAATGTKVSGTLYPLGADLRHHGFFASVTVHGVLELPDGLRMGRVTRSGYKVDVLSRGATWRCLPKDAAVLVQALSDLKAIKVEDVTLTAASDLLADGALKLGPAFPLGEKARNWLSPGSAAAPTPAGVEPLDRHPIQIAEPVFLEGYTTGTTPTLDLGDGVTLPVAQERISAAAGLTVADLNGSAWTVGLLRFDAGAWAVQPLAIGQKKAILVAGSPQPPPKGKKKGDTLAILQERAGKLLRAKT